MNKIQTTVATQETATPAKVGVQPYAKHTGLPALAGNLASASPFACKDAGNARKAHAWIPAFAGMALFMSLLLSTLPAQAAEKETVYDRVMRTQTIRCGYGIAPPYIVKDVNTGKVSGLFADIMEEMGKALALKIDWAEEIGWDQMTIALEAKKVDVICSGLWIAASRGRVVAYTSPVIFNAVEMYARVDDPRFDNAPEKINGPDVTIATDDGGLAEEIAKNDFPLAKTLRAPQMAPNGDLLMDVVTKKADITFSNPSFVVEFEKTNPGKLKRVPMERPVRLYHNAFAVNIHEQELRDMLNAAITELEGAGKIRRIAAKYSSKDYPDILYQPAKPYEAGK